MGGAAGALALEIVLTDFEFISSISKSVCTCLVQAKRKNEQMISVKNLVLMVHSFGKKKLKGMIQ